MKELNSIIELLKRAKKNNTKGIHFYDKKLNLDIIDMIYKLEVKRKKSLKYKINRIINKHLENI